MLIGNGGGIVKDMGSEGGGIAKFGGVKVDESRLSFLVTGGVCECDGASLLLSGPPPR